MHLRGAVLVVLGGVCIWAMAAPALAELSPVATKADKNWKHALTGTVLPPRIGDFVRADVVDYGKVQLDVAATYNAGPKTTATVYLYRAGLADASIWHDRLVKVMGIGRLGVADMGKLQTTVFTITGQGEKERDPLCRALVGQGVHGQRCGGCRPWRLAGGGAPEQHGDGCRTA